MTQDDQGAGDPGEPGRPLPPDDRLWRHPSEVREHGIPGRPVVNVPAPRPTRWLSPLMIVVVAAGTVLSAGFLVGSMALVSGSDPETIEDRVLVTPSSTTSVEMIAAPQSWLGVEVRNHDRARNRGSGAIRGAVIDEVAPGSPAEAAGLATDDVITEVDDVAVESISEVVVAMREHSPGDEVSIGYWRGDEHAETTAVLAERP